MSEWGNQWGDNGWREYQNQQWEMNRRLAAMVDAMPMAPIPDWQTRKIDAACDYWELQMMGICG